LSKVRICDNCNRVLDKGGYQIVTEPLDGLAQDYCMNFTDLCPRCKKWLDMAFEQMKKKVDIKS
jgi:uncharacterized protein with PIN domain